MSTEASKTPNDMQTISPGKLKARQGVKGSHVVITTDNSKLPIAHIGNTVISSQTSAKEVPLHNVYHVPGMGKNLLSVPQQIYSGHTTKGGKGAPHMEIVKMTGAAGVLQWGNSSRRNVIRPEAVLGPSLSFQTIRRKKGNGDESGIFRVTTTKNKEVHFMCEGGFEMAKLWMRGINLVTKEATFVK
ncbi:hypothetical protein ACH5RR_010963 [Cinchona calisaya]|uniref:Retrovirus-related Pol polyprotein from transposon TNT 1-94-like beta-barrel domain-containing protein n=1 Tax=Cinchona calisaya TaxID=153742 RepID=A0ABD3A760_9GENT